jgi:hypothetical protein
MNLSYDTQIKNNDLSNPWIFISTQTQHSKEPGIAPEGCEILEIIFTPINRCHQILILMNIRQKFVGRYYKQQ